MRSFFVTATILLTLAAPADASLVEADLWWAENIEISTFTTTDGLALRYVHFETPEPRGAVVIFTGRTEPVEKYAETLYELRDMPVSFFVFEGRGQGDSDRSLPDREKGHVADWRSYVDDARVFIASVVRPAVKGPVVAMGVSMGAGVLLAGVGAHDFPVEGAIMISPMVRFVTDPFPPWLARGLAWGMDLLGLSAHYAPSTGPWAPIPFEGNRLTSDRERLEAMNQLYELRPELRLGGPTVGWVRQMDLMGDAILLRGFGVPKPMLMILASDDRVVVTDVVRGVCDSSMSCRALELPGRHELLREVEPIRRKVWGAIRTFIGLVIFSPFHSGGL